MSHHHHHHHHHNQNNFQGQPQYNNMNNMGGNDQHLRNSIDQIYAKYDKDNSGNLT
jgi:hypothetical protein